MKLKKTLTWAAALAMAVTPVAAYSAMEEETPAAKEAIPEELVVQGEYDEDGNLRVGDLVFAGENDVNEDGEYFNMLAVGVYSGMKDSITEAVIPAYVRFTDKETGEERTARVTGIGNYPAGGKSLPLFVSFENCKKLKSVTFPDTEITIGYYAFDGCTSLTSIRIPKNVNILLGAAPFGGCTNLTSIEVDPENERLYSVDGVLFSKNPDDTATILRYPAGKTDKAYVIPDNVTDIRSMLGSAFENSSITTLYVPKIANEAIIYYRFFDCPNLTDIYFEGTEEEWNSVEHYNESSSSGGKDPLKDATVHFNAKPTDVDPDWTPDGTPKVTKFSDEETGIEITATSGVLPEGVTFNAKLLDSTADSNSYNLSFTDAAGNEVQPNGKVTVSIPLPEDWETAYAYRVEGGTKTLLQSTIKNGKVVFTTDHFSVYMITAEKLDTSDEPATSETTESEPATSEPAAVTPGASDKNPGSNSANNSNGGSTGSDQQPTGITLAIVPVVLAASAAVVLLKKRK